jgi:uncharacterized membrane protein YqjE
VNAVDPTRTIQGGLLVSLRRLATTVVDMAHTRVALFGTELEEELNRIVAVIVGAMVCLALASLALLFGGLLIVATFWETQRIAALAWVAIGFVLLAGLALVVVWRRGRRRSQLLGATLGEIERDRQMLAGNVR